MMHARRQLNRFGVAATIFLIGVVPSRSEDKRPDPARPFAPNITISRETTWAIEPLRDDGYVDYFEVINRHFGRDVTADNNAAALLYQALGPRPESVRMPDVLFTRMGLKPLTDEGNYFVPLGNWVQQRMLDPPPNLQAIFDQQSQAGARPWTKAEFPLIAGWLEDNAGPLRMVTEAMQRPRYFLPVATDEDGALIAILLPGVQKSREIARALKARAMRELAEGSQLDAWRDLMTLHRLGRHVGHGTTLIEFLVGVAVESMAIEGELRFLSETQPSERLLARYRKDLELLPPRATAIEKLDLGERAISLDAVHRIARGTMTPQQVNGLANDGPIDKLMAGLAAQSLDWDLILKSMNGWYDRICEVGRQDDYRDRLARMKQLDRDLKNLAAKRQGAGALWTLLGGQQAMSQAMADVLVSMLLPAANQCLVAEGRAIQRMSNLDTAMALAAWRSEHGAYPESLEALAPQFLPAAPTDLFSGQPLHYKGTADSYLLYSIGDNGIDEEGRSFDDQPRGDDLVVRMPVAVK